MSPSKSIQTRLGFLFGSALESLASGIRPSELEVIQHWMFKFDVFREQDVTKPIDRKSVLDSVVNSIVENFRTCGDDMTADDDYKIFQRVKNLSNKAEKLAKNTRRKTDHDWIEENRRNFEKTFELLSDTLGNALEKELHIQDPQPSMPSVASPLPPRLRKKRKRFEIEESFDGTFESGSSKVRYLSLKSG